MPERGAKAIARAVQQHPEITAVDLKFAAYEIFVFFVEENAAEQLAVLVAQFAEHAADELGAPAAVELAVRPGLQSTISGAFSGTWLCRV